jgi:hypothetical protein
MKSNVFLGLYGVDLLRTYIGGGGLARLICIFYTAEPRVPIYR